MRIAIIANCQSSVYRSHIGVNLERVEFINIAPVHTIQNNLEEIKRIFKELIDVDYIITQPLSDKFGLLSLESLKLSFKDKMIIVPNIYFTGYCPDLIYLKDSSHKTYKVQEFDYHILPIVYCFVKKYTVNQTICMLNLLDTDESICNKFWNASLNELKNKEKECTIIASDIIEKNENKSLFYSFNHPNRIIMNEISKRVLSIIAPKEQYKFIYNDLLSSTIYPVPISIQKLKKLDCTSLYKIDHILFTEKEIVKKYFDNYKNIPLDILESTLSYYEETNNYKELLALYENFMKV